MQLYLINTAFFSCEGGAMFGIIPPRVWQKHYPSTNGLCPMHLHSLLIVYKDRKILIDTGVGDKEAFKLKSYGFKGVTHLRQYLPTIGILPEEITDVVLTHLHFDHCGGCTYRDENRLKVTFPNATHWVSQSQLDYALNPHIIDRDAYQADHFMPLIQSNLLKTITKDTCLTNEIELKLFDGHTFGQIVVSIRSDHRGICFAGDVIPTLAHLSDTWISAYDLQPMVSVDSKKALLQQIYNNNQMLITSHDAYTPAATLRKMGNIFKINKKFDMTWQQINPV